MLSKKNRLAKDSDVQRVMRRGRTFFDPCFTIKGLKGLPTSRFTVVVSTKVSKSAVQRNRIKRVVREYLRLNMQNMPIADYMIIARQKVSGFTNHELLASIEGALRRNRLLK